MQEKKKNRLRKALKYKLENILEEAKDIHRVLIVLNDYCKIRSNSESIYNITNMLKELENKSENVVFNLHQILNSDAEVVSNFLSKIIPLDETNYTVDE